MIPTTQRMQESGDGVHISWTMQINPAKVLAATVGKLDPNHKPKMKGYPWKSKATPSVTATARPC